jgi:hypothetical protein
MASLRRAPLRPVNGNSHRDISTNSTKSVRKSLKVDKVANQLKAIESLESAQQLEKEGDLEEALRYYEIAQDHLPIPSADLRVVSASDVCSLIYSQVKIMSLKSSSDSKFKQGQKKGKVHDAGDHQQEVYDIVNKVKFSIDHSCLIHAE